MNNFKDNLKVDTEKFRAKLRDRVQEAIVNTEAKNEYEYVEKHYIQNKITKVFDDEREL